MKALHWHEKKKLPIEIFQNLQYAFIQKNLFPLCDAGIQIKKFLKQKMSINQALLVLLIAGQRLL